MKKPLFFYFLLLFVCCSDPEFTGDDELNETLEPTSASCENFLECNENKFFINYENSEGKIYVDVIKFSNSETFIFKL